MISISEYKKLTTKKAAPKLNAATKPKRPKKPIQPIDNKMQIRLFEQFLKIVGVRFRKEVMMNEIIKTRRKFRFDYYLPDLNTAVEINGGEWIGGRHNSGTGYQTDLVKSNLANLNGVKYLQYTYSQLQEKLYENDLRFLIHK